MKHALFGKIRDYRGKGNSRKLRKNGKIPAVIYSKEIKTLNIEIYPRKIENILRGPLKRNVLISIFIEGQKNPINVMVKDIQIHKIKRSIIHVDFIVVNSQKEITIKIPLVLFGKNTLIIQGGNLFQVKKMVKIKSLPLNIPSEIRLDISEASFGSVCAGDIVMPQNVSLIENLLEPVVIIKKPRKKIVKIKPKDDDSPIISKV